MFERRYSMGMRGGRDFLPGSGRRELPPLPPLGRNLGGGSGSSGGNSMRSGGGGGGGYEMFSRRSPQRNNNGMNRFG